VQRDRSTLALAPGLPRARCGTLDTRGAVPRLLPPRLPHSLSSPCHAAGLAGLKAEGGGGRSGVGCLNPVSEAPPRQGTPCSRPIRNENLLTLRTVFFFEFWLWRKRKLKGREETRRAAISRGHSSGHHLGPEVWTTSTTETPPHPRAKYHTARIGSCLPRGRRGNLTAGSSAREERRRR